MLPAIVKQTALRTGAIFAGKCIGLVGRVTLTRLLGAEGIGLYQIAYSFYGIALMVITGGLPTALALFTAKHPAKGWGAFRNMSVLVALIGAASGFLVYSNSGVIATMLGNDQLAAAVRYLAPALIAVPLLQLLRGYMQGTERYGVISVSELVEQGVRVALLITLVILFSSHGIGAALGAGITGTAIGALVAFIIITIYVAASKQIATTSAQTWSYGGELSILFRTSLAIGFTRMLVPASDFIDSILIPRRLQAAGNSVSEATAMYGVFMGMAIVIAYVPTIVTAAVSHTMTMKIAADFQQGRMYQYHRKIEKVLKLGWTWGSLSGMFLFLYASELSNFIFGTPEATEPIRFLSAIPLIVGLRELTTSMLWAQERKSTPLVGLIGGIGLSTVLLYFLLALPGFGYKAASIGTLTLETVAVLWNLRALRSKDTTLFQLKWIGWDLVLFIVIMLFVFPFAMQHIHLSHVTTVACSMLLYCTCAAFIIGIRMKHLK
ncbi:oligosaccharide flippase family protein [Paenibacillus sp. MER TA 81-3]|uniref:oligosaccharide flippase family protein n=1 Tax=Paenibacillus sp. MER TA 81-3 TaxID=2939573 RepID=UPI00203FBBC6|nr:oligosaccharide flippase family protein [Paenibacillus sp. MER TA 81-3]MCM3339713.1 oligosaccharide flippase family protein [Paenibacillus sp. MER TA 81-3]